MFEEKPEVYALLDLESGNAVSYFDTRDEGEDALLVAAQENPAEAADWVLVGYTKTGDAISSTLGSAVLSVA